MDSITMTLNESNQRAVAEIILKNFGLGVFNILVERKVPESEETVVHKFCGRKIKGDRVKINRCQVCIPTEPGGSIAWDLTVEHVTVKFETDNMTICRSFLKSGQDKILVLTKNPI